MANHEFRQFLEGKQLAERSINHYCGYVRSMLNVYGIADVRKLVESKDKAIEYISGLVKSPMQLPIRSAMCYRRAICLLYEFLHHEQLDKKSFPKWQTEGLRMSKWEREEYRKAHPEYFIAQWYQVVVVNDPHEWLTLISGLNGSDSGDIRSWAFRGQGDAKWGLETSLGRSAKFKQGDDVEKGRWLRLFEKETMWEFGRESAKSLEYRGFEGVDLLSLVQHYGGKTRLLDFSLAPLLALYMAVEQNETDFAKVRGFTGLSKEIKGRLSEPDFAVWAIDLSLIGRFSKCNKESLKCFNGMEVGTVEEEFATVETMLKEGDTVDEKGIHVVFPKTCNDRLSAQEGLFLMPKSLACSFENNLKEALLDGDILKKEYSGLFLSEYQPEVIEKEGDRPKLIKFIFPSSSLGSVKRLLAEANVTAKHVYPDLTGLGRYVSIIVDQHCQKWR